MIEIGQHNELYIKRATDNGLYLSDNEGEEVLLPNKYCPDNYTINDILKVFVYRDFEDRVIATNLQPKVLLNEFAFLTTTSVAEVGAFVDWGLEKDLMVPFSEQREKMVEGNSYVVYLDLDSKTNRLFGCNKIEKCLQNDILTVEEGDEVKLLVYKKTALGYKVIVNNIHDGLVYHNEVFSGINVGDSCTGFVKKIRDDDKVDIVLQAQGYKYYIDHNCNLVLNKLKDNNGFIALNDKSNPEAIYKELAISKKAFKKAIGALYKEKEILITEKGITFSTKK